MDGPDGGLVDCHEDGQRNEASEKTADVGLDSSPVPSIGLGAITNELSEAMTNEESGDGMPVESELTYGGDALAEGYIVSSPFLHFPFHHK